MARPTQHRSEISPVMVRFAPAERAEVDAAAERAGATRSAFIRDAALALARSGAVTDIQNSGAGEGAPVTDIQNPVTRELRVERDE